MVAKDILPVLALQLRNLFALTDSEFETLSKEIVFEHGFEKTIECFKVSSKPYPLQRRLFTNSR